MRRFSPQFLLNTASIGILLGGISEAGATGASIPAPAPKAPSPAISTPSLPNQFVDSRPKPKSEKEAQLMSILQNWEIGEAQWKDAYQKANAQEQARLKGSAPDGAETAKNIWNLIRTGLSSQWSTPGIAWLLGHPHELAKFPNDMPKAIRDALLNAVDAYHVIYPGAKDLCPVLSVYDYSIAKDSRYSSQTLLEKIYRANDDPVAKAYAALGMAIRLRLSGSAFDIESAKTRVSHILFALHHLKGDAFGGMFGTRKVEDVIREEMYRLDNLTELKLPPQIKAQTLDGDVFDSRASNGKVKLIYFWNPTDPSTAGSILAIDRLHKKLAPGGKYESVAITHMTEKDLRDLKEQHALTMPMIADTTGAISFDYRTSGMSEAYLADRRGLLRFNEIIQNLLALVPVVENLIAEKDSAAPKPAVKPSGTGRNSNTAPGTPRR